MDVQASTQLLQPCNFAANVLKQLACFKHDDIMTDFTIIVGNHRIRAHRLVLAACSPYFSAMFTSSGKAGYSSDLSLSNVHFNTVDHVINYMYGTKIKMHFNTKHALMEASDLLEVCALFQLNDLKQELCHVITKNMTAENCLGWWKIANTWKLEDLKRVATNMVCGDFETVITTDDFKRLSFVDLVEVITLDRLKGVSRDPVLAACFYWMNDDIDERKTHLQALLKCVQLECCSWRSITGIISRYQQDIPEVEETVLMHVKRANLLEANVNVVVLGGMTEHAELNNTCWVLQKSVLPKWVELMKVPNDVQAIRSPVVSIPNGFLFPCGGSSCKKTSLYDGLTKTWRTLCDCPVGLTDLAAVYCNNAVYILGGTLNGTRPNQNTVYHFDLNTETWHQDPPMLLRQAFPTCASMGKYIYVVYNCDVLNCEKDSIPLQRFCVTTKTWIYLEELPQSVGVKPVAAALVALDNSLYLVGGVTNILARYDIDTNSWSHHLRRPSRGCYYNTVFVMDKKLYLCGGGWDYNVQDQVEEYSVHDDRWRENGMIRMPQKLVHYVATAVNFL